MLLNGKLVGELDYTDLINLVGVDESRTIDFKSAAYPSHPPDTERWKTELCADVAAFANSIGGWIICGVRENNGRATDLVGIDSTADPEREILRLEQVLLHGVEPNIPGLTIRAVELNDSTKGPAIVIMVPRTFTGPHRVKASGKFHIRRSTGKDQMNIDEIRSAFNLSSVYIDRIKAFRKRRVEVLATEDHEDIPIPLADGFKMILHVVPLAFSEFGSPVDLSTLSAKTPPPWVHQSYLSGGHPNLEGYVRPDGNASPETRLGGYTQVYRNGIVEAVETGIPQDFEPYPLMFLNNIEDFAINNLLPILIAQENLGIGTPLVIMLSLANVRGLELFPYWQARRDPFHNYTPLKRDTIPLPDTVINSYSVDIHSVLKPIFDILWNTGGWRQSNSFDQNGNWKNR